jgi:pyruvate-ferredoxin/flavodoxin oxidoreductase
METKMSKNIVTIDGNEAAAYIAHKTNEVCAIYPITPSSGMGEWADTWSSQNEKNIWGTVPDVMEMQSEGGAAGAVHGALQTGALTTTFTASQGLLLMIPNMYKIAGELTPTVFHVSARTIATHALSIFGDHSDVMATRQTGFALLSSNSVQEVMDLALISQSSTLESRIPFLHFFDGFRTSHEVMKIEKLGEEQIKAMIDNKLVRQHRERALNPNKPVLRGTAQNPDVFFQARESANHFYDNTPDIVQGAMDKFATITGRQYHLFDYVGSPTAERVIILMGSGAETAHETVDYLNKLDENVGILKVRLFRPFSAKHFIDALPNSVKKIAVLDRTKESGSLGEPLYLDIVTVLAENPVESNPTIVGGRYGLSSKEFTPAMIKSIFDELNKDKPKNHFTIGINDDVNHTSLDYDSSFSTSSDKTFRGMFFGMGADGTVGANKNSIKIIGETTDNYAQGYFVYDSKKSGSTTTSHLRFGEDEIKSTYLITRANFIACHNFEFLKSLDMLKNAINGATFLLNSPYPADEVWNHIPKNVQETILEKKIKVYSINALKVAQETGMGGRINTIMQTCFFAISGILSKDESINKIKQYIEKTYGIKGENIVNKNFNAVDQSLANLHEVKIPNEITGKELSGLIVPDHAPDFVKNVTAEIIAGKGDELPVSAFPVDGTWPTATTQFEKRNVASEVPVWDQDICIQCNKCALACPHAAIRPKIYEPGLLENAPDTFKSIQAKGKDFKEELYTLQVAVEDCTGCDICVDVCPARSKDDPDHKAINMQSQLPLREEESKNWDFFLNIPELGRDRIKHGSVKGSQMLQPLFEFSGACSGCGETPYVKLASQLFGDRMVIANATGCSSIYGGNLPTTPWAKNNDSRGPAWSNSLFEDNAEFGLGYRLTIDKHMVYGKELLTSMKDEVGTDLTDAILNADQSNEPGIFEQRQRVEELNAKLSKIDSDSAKELLSVSDNLVKKSVWIMGGDGWAYDIGFGGLDHVMASGKNVNILVLDTEVYSNTGGQSSKATPWGAIAKFAASGKDIGKKDMGMIAMSYGNVYVARVAMGANDTQTVKAFMEAEAFDGPSIIMAYSHCIAHGYDMGDGMKQQKIAVESGHWMLYRFNPSLAVQGKNPLLLDSKAPTKHIKEFMYNENRFKMLTKIMPERAEKLLKNAERDAKAQYKHYAQLSKIDMGKEE